MIVYEPVTTNILAQWSWSTDLSGVYTFEMITPGDSKIVITSNPDLSGSMMFYEYVGASYELVFEIEWASDGSGEYWTYDGGVETDHGTWV